jgi:hypothetical protein
MTEYAKNSYDELEMMGAFPPDPEAEMRASSGAWGWVESAPQAGNRGFSRRSRLLGEFSNVTCADKLR